MKRAIRCSMFHWEWYDNYALIFLYWGLGLQLLTLLLQIVDLNVKMTLLNLGGIVQWKSKITIWCAVTVYVFMIRSKLTSLVWNAMEYIGIDVCTATSPSNSPVFRPLEALPGFYYLIWNVSDQFSSTDFCRFSYLDLCKLVLSHASLKCCQLGGHGTENVNGVFYSSLLKCSNSGHLHYYVYSPRRLAIIAGMECKRFWSFGTMVTT